MVSVISMPLKKVKQRGEGRGGGEGGAVGNELWD